MSDLHPSTTRHLERHRSGWTVLVAAFAPLPVVLILIPLRGVVDNTATALLLLLVVVAASGTNARGAGIAAVVSSGFWFDVFATTPHGRLRIDNRSDLVTTVLLVLVGAAVAAVAEVVKRRRARAELQAGYLRGVVRAMQIAALGPTSDQELTAYVSHQIRLVLGVTRCYYVAGPVRDSRTPLLGHGGMVIRDGCVLDVDVHGLPTDFETALIVTRHGAQVGSFRVLSAAEVVRPSREQRQVARLLADQLTAVFSR